MCPAAAGRPQVRRGARGGRRPLDRRARTQRRRHRRPLRHGGRSGHHRRHLLQVAGLDRRIRGGLGERHPLPAASLPAADFHRVAPAGQHRRACWRRSRCCSANPSGGRISGPTPGGCRRVPQLGFDIGPSETPIVPVLIGPLEKTFLMWRKLFDAGVFTNPVAPPAVPPSQCRLRTSLMATHTVRPDRLRARDVRAYRQGAGGYLTGPVRVRPARDAPGPQPLHRSALPAARAGPALGPAVASGRRDPALPHARTPSSSTPRPSISSPSATARSSAASPPSATGCTTRPTATGSASSASSSRSTTRRSPTRCSTRPPPGSAPRGFDTMRGPGVFSTNDECGLLVDGFEHAAHAHDAAQPAVLRRPARAGRVRQGQGPAGAIRAADRPADVPVPERLARGTELITQAHGHHPPRRST